jgi:hypothetical protein
LIKEKSTTDSGGETGYGSLNAISGALSLESTSQSKLY